MALLMIAMVIGCGAAFMFHGEVGRHASYYVVSAFIPMWLTTLMVRPLMPPVPPLTFGGGVQEATFAHYAGGLGTLLIIPTGFIGIAIFRRYETQVREFVADLIDSF